MKNIKSNSNIHGMQILKRPLLLMSVIFVLGGLACSDGSSVTADKPTNDMGPPAAVIAPLTGDRPESKTWELKQNSHKDVTESFVLDPAEKYSVTFIQGNETPPPIDILLIIDNSGSMSDTQAKLSEKLAYLLKELKYTDWQINVITTDNPCETDPRLPLTPHVSGYEVLFQEIIKAIGTGGGEETGMAMLIQHIRGEARDSGKCTPKPWLRKGSAFVVIEVTDEIERIYSGTSKAATVDEVIDALAEKKYLLTENTKFFGLFYPPQFTKEQCDCADTTQGPNMTLADLIDKSKGTWGNICATDYSQALSEISANASAFTRTSFPLGHIPAIGTIKVDHNGVLIGGEGDEEGASSAWSVIDDLFIYNHPLAPDDELYIEYMLKDPRSYNLAQIPLEGTIQVSSKKHKYKFGTEISYRSGENTLYFYDSLNAGEEITISYQTPVVLKTEFDFPHTETGFVQCSAQGEPLSLQYLKNENKVIFQSPPEEGAKIICHYD